MASREERELIKALDEKALWESLRPAINAILKHGEGNANLLLKKSETLAAVSLITALASKKDDVRLKASIELLNRSLGKPVERRIDVYADLGSLNETEIDTQIQTMMKQIGETKAFDAVMGQLPKLAEGRHRRSKVQRRRTEREAAGLMFEGEGVVGGEVIERAEGGAREASQAEVTSSGRKPSSDV